jgi:hypothetical protein
MTRRLQDEGEGERRKLGALALLRDGREALVRRAQRAVLGVLMETGRASADDVRGLVELPPGVNAKVLGAAPGPLARAGIIRGAGYAKTCRPVAHARPVTIWMLADRAAAERWLRHHPDLPEPAKDERAADVQGFLFPEAKEPTPTGDAAGVAKGEQFA